MSADICTFTDKFPHRDAVTHVAELSSFAHDRTRMHRGISRGMQALGWICSLIMSAAAIALWAFLR